MTRVRHAAGRTFEAFQSRNYRWYFAGQVISVSGVWMQMVAQTWLVLQLTGSGAALGLVTAVQFLPMLVLGPWAGVLADRLDKRRFLIVLQVIPALLAVALGVLTLLGAVSLALVLMSALALGLVNAFEMPARQAFAFELVGERLLPNAVSLNSVVMNGARVAGPALAAIVLSTAGVAACFLANAVSYVAAIVALVALRPHELHRAEPTPRAKGQLREGLRYVWSEPSLRTPLLLMLAIGTLTYEYPVTLPLLANFTFGQGAEGYSVLLVAMSVGAVGGGLVGAAMNGPSLRHLGLAGLALGALTVLTGLMPNLLATAAILPFVGVASISFVSRSNATLQLNARPEMRGRVLALFAVAFLGTSPIGGPIVGWLAEAYGPRVSLIAGGLVAVLAVGLAWRSLVRHESLCGSSVAAGCAREVLEPASLRLAAPRTSAPSSQPSPTERADRSAPLEPAAA